MLACMNNKIKVVKKLKETKKHVIDIGDTLMKDTTLSYIDGLIIIPVGVIIMRLFRKDLLKLKENTSKTCWTNKNNNNKSSMRNQF